jgi:hypothetical protein
MNIAQTIILMCFAFIVGCAVGLEQKHVTVRKVVSYAMWIGFIAATVALTLVISQ